MYKITFKQLVFQIILHVAILVGIIFFHFFYEPFDFFFF